MSLKELTTNSHFLSFVQRLAVIGVLGAILWRDAANTTGWALFGAAVADLFHSAKNGNGMNGYSNGNGATK
jgi:hypothetical protein